MVEMEKNKCLYTKHWDRSVALRWPAEQRALRDGSGRGAAQRPPGDRGVRDSPPPAKSFDICALIRPTVFLVYLVEPKSKSMF